MQGLPANSSTVRSRFSCAERAGQDQHPPEQLRGQRLAVHQRAHPGRGHGTAGMKRGCSPLDKYMAFSYSSWVRDSLNPPGFSPLALSEPDGRKCFKDTQKQAVKILSAFSRQHILQEAGGAFGV